jgi:sn-glycerol 3-phosphate transport system ATP-binding protein
MSLLGPSGCGKTTTLRLVAGIEEPTSGTIRIGDRDVTNLAPGHRDIAMVFQNYALYPHLSVRENLTLNLRVAKVPRTEIAARATETARLLEIEPLLDKRPGMLSGGQRQRVALGRAIIRRPTAFLMDEPLSNLDVKLREQMRTEIKRLHRRLGITTLYVTHDQVEAMTMSDRIAVMDRGRLQQIGTPDEVYNQPRTLFVAEFIGSPGINILQVDDRTALHALLPGLASRSLPADLALGIRPEDIELTEIDEATLTGTIDFVEPVGPVAYAFVRLDGNGLALQRRDRLIVTIDARRGRDAGRPVGIRLHPERLHLFDSASGEAVAHDRWQAAPLQAQSAAMKGINQRIGS